MNQHLSASDPSLFEKMKEKIFSAVDNGDILIVIPPFYDIGFLALGPYLLQAISKKYNYRVDVLHLDLLLAHVIGTDNYREIHDSPIFWMLGERMFARSAYGLPKLGKDSSLMADQFHSISDTKKANLYLNHTQEFDLGKYHNLEEICYQFVEYAAIIIAELNYKIVGVSLGFCNQINATVALINQVKKSSPNCISIIGGSYCEGEKAKTLFSLSDCIDHIFEGESEVIFVEFINNVFQNKPNEKRLIKAQKEVPLENMPIADYGAYARQVKLIMGNEYYEDTIKAIWYETNRGCWWAEKAKCTFCGIAEIGFRQKSVARIAKDLKEIKEQIPDKLLFFTDLIMSEQFPEKLLAYDKDTTSYPVLGMQLKVGRTIEDVLKLSQIKARYILPGVESFSTSLLKKMKKGTTGKQNIYFLRNTYCFGISTQYYLLWGFPDDNITEYADMLKIIPAIKHLQPPLLFDGAQVSRDSPYFMEPEKYNIKGLHHWNVYNMIFPESTDIESLANYFVADYNCYSYQNLHLIKAINKEILDWQQVWREVRLDLSLFMGKYMIYDSRQIDTDEPVTHAVNYDEVRELMNYQRYKKTDTLDWALENKLGLLMDGWYVPLVTASPKLLLNFEYSKENHKYEQV